MFSCASVASIGDSDLHRDVTWLGAIAGAGLFSDERHILPRNTAAAAAAAATAASAAAVAVAESAWLRGLRS